MIVLLWKMECWGGVCEGAAGQTPQQTSDPYSTLCATVSLHGVAISQQTVMNSAG